MKSAIQSLNEHIDWLKAYYPTVQTADVTAAINHILQLEAEISRLQTLVQHNQDVGRSTYQGELTNE